MFQCVKHHSERKSTGMGSMDELLPVVQFVMVCWTRLAYNNKILKIKILIKNYYQNAFVKLTIRGL